MITMKTGRDYIDFYDGNHSFYEVGLREIRTRKNANQWLDHMKLKRWFVDGCFIGDFRQALDNWLECGDATASRARC